MKVEKQKTRVSGYILFVILFTVAAILFIYLADVVGKVSEETVTAAEASTLPTIIIDAGHGGEDGGTVGVGGVLEKDINLEIAFLLRDMLVSSGYNVVLTRSEDILLYDRSSNYEGRKKALDLSARVKLAKSYENCIFVSIHMNSFPDARYSGLQVYYSKNDSNSKLLADEVQNLVCNELQKDNNRKTKAAGSNIFVLDRITSPAILIECGFLSNSEECAALNTAEYRQRLSLLISLAIQKYIRHTT